MKQRSGSVSVAWALSFSVVLLFALSSSFAFGFSAEERSFGGDVNPNPHRPSVQKPHTPKQLLWKNFDSSSLSQKQDRNEVRKNTKFSAPVHRRPFFQKIDKSVNGPNSIPKQPQLQLQRFDDFSVVRIKITSPKQRELLLSLTEQRPQQISIWSHDSTIPPLMNNNNNQPVPVIYVDLMATNEMLEFIRREFSSFFFNNNNNNKDDFVVMIENVQQLIDQQREEAAATTSAASWFEEYHTFESIVHKVREIAQTRTDLVTYWSSIGSSIEGRNIVSVSLYGKDGSNTGPVPQILITGGQHAREWIAPATVMYVYDQLVSGYGKDTEITNLLNKVNITIVPVVNPDGYDYTWTNSRMWRKNRRRNANGSYGVDLNRNWDAHWGGSGSSKTPSSDTYCGTAPFSEPETDAVAKLFTRLSPVKAAIDVHSYSQLILRPYGWTTSPPPNVELLKEVGSKMASIIKEVHGKTYISEAESDLYLASGTAEDWFYDKGAELSYTFELRDTGEYGFLLPAKQIIPTGEEIWAALKYFLQFAASN